MTVAAGSPGHAQRSPAPTTVNWPLHNLDLAGTRFSTLDQINTSNVKSLVPALAVPARRHRRRQQPDDAGHRRRNDVRDRPARQRVRARRGRRASALDLRRHRTSRRRTRKRATSSATAASATPTASSTSARARSCSRSTRRPASRVPTFGKNGQASVILDVVKMRYPDVNTAISLGYWFTTAPQFYNGVLYIGSTRSESHIPGGHVLAVDAKTGKVLWHFNTIPQDEKDQGWDIAGPTWVGGERNGGGIWETPSIDPELGLLYVGGRQSVRRQHEAHRHEPLHRFDHRADAQHRHAEVVLPADASRRLGLRLGQSADPLRHAGARPAREGARRGEQERLSLHPESRNRKAGASDQGNAGADDDPRPGEQPWPTQPIPFTAAGKPMEPVCPVFPLDIPAERLATRKARAAVHAAGPESDLRAGNRGRRELRSDVLQPADRAALRERRSTRR